MLGFALPLARRGTAAAEGPPAALVPPAVAGTAQQGAVLTASPGSWTGAPSAFAYQWRRGGVDIPGAVSPAYTAGAADVGRARSVQVTATNAAGSGAAVSAATAPVAPSLAVLPLAPASRWHPGFSAVTAAGGRVVSAEDLTGLAAATEGAAGIGPLILTDGLGRTFWRFEGAQYLTVATGLTFANTRETTVFMVGRIHRPSFNTRIFSGGSVAAGTAGNGATLLDARAAAANEPAFVGNARAAPTGKEHMVTGSQLQVMGSLRRTTANGGNVYFLNRKTCVEGAQGSGTTNVNGAEIGRYSFSPGASGSWGSFDLYELIVYNTQIGVSNAQAVAAALADHYNIPEVTAQLVLEGDSITFGTAPVTGPTNGAMVLTEPGAGFIPAHWRVLNVASGGAQVPTLVTRRDATNSWAAQVLSGGQNVVAVEIGRNDMAGSGGNLTAAQHYANFVSYLNTASTGVLQRGWTVRVMANIASGAGPLQDRIIDYRALLRNPQFLTDTASRPGDPFDGKVSIVSTDLIEDGPGNTVFLTAADALDPAYYAGDQTHPTVLGARVRVTGGTTPAYGAAWGL